MKGRILFNYFAFCQRFFYLAPLKPVVYKRSSGMAGPKNTDFLCSQPVFSRPLANKLLLFVSVHQSKRNYERSAPSVARSTVRMMRWRTRLISFSLRLWSRL